MSLLRYAKKTDSNQAAIVAALRACGVQIWIISQPCDLLTYYRGRWLPLELKVKKNRPRKDQERQNEFIAATGCPVVTSVQEALDAVIQPLAKEAICKPNEMRGS